MFTRSVEGAITRVAENFGVEPAALMAVAWVESAGTPFWTVKGKPVPAVRYEGHYAWRLSSGKTREKFVAAGLASPRAQLVRNPRSYEARYAMVDRAMAIDERIAIQSCSWGLGQVMGSHWQKLGYASPQELMASATESVEGQVDLMMRFIEQNGLVRYLNKHDWAGFAKRYNGPSYKRFKYDTQMARAYARMKKGDTGETMSVRDLQTMLKALGYYNSSVDGIAGGRTKQAVRNFQRDYGLVVDGIAGSMTLKELREAYNRKSSKKSRTVIKSAAVASGPVVAAAGGATEAITNAPEPVAASTTPSVGVISSAVDSASSLGSTVMTFLENLGLPTIVVVSSVALVAAGVIWWALREVEDDEVYDLPEVEDMD